MMILTNNSTLISQDKKKLEQEEIQRLLKNTSLFKSLPQSELENLSAHCKLIHKPKGSIIYRKEDSSNHMYVIKSGYIMESVYYGGSVDVIVKIRNTGEYFGEMGMLSAETYPNTALALEESTLLSIPRTYFLDTVWNNCSVCKVIILELIDRLIHSCQNMVNSMYLDAPGRLAFTIVNLTTNSQQKSMNIRVTQSALAASSGMARQTAAKILSDWRKVGWISTERGKLVVRDFDQLLNVILNSELGS